MMTWDTIYIEGRGIENVRQTIEDLRAKRDSLMEVDYVKNKAQVNELNKQIVQLQMAQQGQLGRMRG
jgi:phage regulator Rha-like protein